MVLGTLPAPLPALFLLPWFATVRMPEKGDGPKGSPLTKLGPSIKVLLELKLMF